jgi:hypothetical protein
MPGFLVALWTAGAGIGMAAYAPQIPPAFFRLSYGMLLAATILSLGRFLTSRLVSTKRVGAYLKKTSPRWTFWSWALGGSAVIVILGVFSIAEIYSIQINRELYGLKGILISADEPDEPGPCDRYPSVAGKLKIMMGSITLATDRRSVPVITIKNKPVLTIEQLADGRIALSAVVIGYNGKPFLLIDNNNFEIHRNRIFDSGSAPRTDKSTIVLRDEDGNMLKVKYVNDHTVDFTGSIYIRPDAFLIIDQKGITILPQRPHGTVNGPLCAEMERDSTGGFAEVQ